MHSQPGLPRGIAPRVVKLFADTNAGMAAHYGPSVAIGGWPAPIRTLNWGWHQGKRKVSFRAVQRPGSRVSIRPAGQGTTSGTGLIHPSRATLRLPWGWHPWVGTMGHATGATPVAQTAGQGIMLATGRQAQA